MKRETLDDPKPKKKSKVGKRGPAAQKVDRVREIIQMLATTSLRNTRRILQSRWKCSDPVYSLYMTQVTDCLKQTALSEAEIARPIILERLEKLYESCLKSRPHTALQALDLATKIQGCLAPTKQIIQTENLEVAKGVDEMLSQQDAIQLATTQDEAYLGEEPINQAVEISDTEAPPEPPQPDVTTS